MKNKLPLSLPYFRENEKKFIKWNLTWVSELILEQLKKKNP